PILSVNNFNRYDDNYAKSQITNMKDLQNEKVEEQKFSRYSFNCEPPLSLLMKEGFITQTSLYYVRNHEPAPELSLDTYRLVADG
ncbi:9429_t:CDS:2, partial [Gigaspora margarita]